MVPVVLSVGLVTVFPAVAASYQVMFCPAGTVAAAVSVCIGLASHWVMFPDEMGAKGAALMVSVTAVLVSELQVPSFA